MYELGREGKLMKNIKTITNWQAFVFLWRHDPEARWFWFKCFIKFTDLREDVEINLRSFGPSSEIELDNQWD